MTKTKGMAAVWLLLLFNSATGETALETCQKQIFEYLDGNKDGSLSRAEAAAEPMRMNARFFDMSDSDGDGQLGYREYLRLGMFVDCELCPAVPDCAAAR